MDLDDQFELEHLFLSERICRTCNIRKNLIEGFYRTRKNNMVLSSYSYECKECTINRVKANRNKKPHNSNWEYPDW